MSSFQAKRNYTSGEYLALKRQLIERTLTRPPSINLQDSSEFTARTRKMASVMPENLPSQGNSTNMVKWRDCSVVQAMLEGQSYRASASTRQPRVDSQTCQRDPNYFLTTTHSVATTPKVQECPIINPGQQRVYESFNVQNHFGMRKNDNKVVRDNVVWPSNTCQTCVPHS